MIKIKIKSRCCMTEADDLERLRRLSQDFGDNVEDRLSREELRRKEDGSALILLLRSQFPKIEWTDALATLPNSRAKTFIIGTRLRSSDERLSLNIIQYQLNGLSPEFRLRVSTSEKTRGGWLSTDAFESTSKHPNVNSLVDKIESELKKRGLT